ncbi:DUF6000 family protein [Nonomuraea sp. NPDC048826]|uniref:DUF6000 family protein n=1 Tax=Nonomuraea sp. NPDC048826 TaxID=3364347 RepID=UPI00371B3299
MVSRSITAATPRIVSSVEAVEAELVALAVSGRTVRRRPAEPVHPRLPVTLREMLVMRRHVTTGRRYLMLLGGFMVQMPDRQVVRFGKALARDARRISDDDLRLMLDGEWRSRLTAAWLIGLDRRTRFREQLGTRLLDSEFVYAGAGYCFALARFGEAEDAAILAGYLDRYLPQVDCDYDQTSAIGALLYLDERHGTDRAARFLVPGGLWQWSVMRDKDPADEKRYMDELCAFADACMSGRLKEWLPRRRRFVDETWD